MPRGRRDPQGGLRRPFAGCCRGCRAPDQRVQLCPLVEAADLPSLHTCHHPKQVGGSGVLVQPMTYIFDEEPARWRALLQGLGVDPASVNV